jgi:hypothetical protein
LYVIHFENSMRIMCRKHFVFVSSVMTYNIAIKIVYDRNKNEWVFFLKYSVNLFEWSILPVS